MGIIAGGFSFFETHIERKELPKTIDLSRSTVERPDA